MDGKSNSNWIVEDDDDDVTDSISNEFITEESMCSSFSSYEQSERFNHVPKKYLPKKRGLSMFYQGKAQSFGSLARVKSIQDLPKKEKPNYRNKVKSCNNFGLSTPKTTITKESSRGSCLSMICSSFFLSCTKGGKL
ncbi:unnamed protein product [Lathyrus oleraceus]|uniref:Uncharacterized protein n=1 Tax=Pisum sativum TaxID=3888 RepID=A0A9D4W816_PEA|nr:protein OXIDATIVE STRESS 3-like [Pisum sativum]KAI5396752.1 hypothetical protein KIW84_062835 [Pisum sativum]